MCDIMKNGIKFTFRNIFYKGVTGRISHYPFVISKGEFFNGSRE